MLVVKTEKDDSILELLKRLTEDLDTSKLAVVDHWEADLCAIGVARADTPRVLAYISTSNEAAGQYSLELEMPGLSSDPSDYKVAGNWEELSYSSLKEHLEEHFRLTRHVDP